MTSPSDLLTNAAYVLQSKATPEQRTMAATERPVMKTPSTPKGVKKVCRLRVSRKGTGSFRSSSVLQIWKHLNSADCSTEAACAQQPKAQTAATGGRPVAALPRKQAQSMTTGSLLAAQAAASQQSSA